MYVRLSTVSVMIIINMMADCQTIFCNDFVGNFILIEPA